MFKENTAYIILALIAIVLIGVTIGLQIVILAERQTASDEPEAETSILKSSPVPGQLPEVNRLQADLNSGQNLAGQVAMAVATATSTPVVVVIEPTPVPPTPVPPTPVPPTLAPPTSVPPTAVPTSQPEVPTTAETSIDTQGNASIETDNDGGEIVAVPPTATSFSAPLPTVTSSADYLFGYVDRGNDCVFITQTVETVLIQQLGIQVRTVPFNDSSSLFSELAGGGVDFTLCYIDPDDRQLMRQYLGDIRQIGFQHYSGDGYKLQLWANGGSKAEIREQSPCMLDFLEKIDFTNFAIEGQTTDSFIQENGSTITNWLDCPHR